MDLVSYQTMHQDGCVITAGFDWDQTGVNLTPQGVNDVAKIGLIFEFDTSSGASFKKPSQLGLWVIPGVPPTSQATVTLYIYPGFTTTDFSVANQPAPTDYPVCRVTGDVQSGDNTWVQDTLFTYQLGKTYSGGVWTTNTTYVANIQLLWARYMASSRWQGRLALSHICSINPLVGAVTGPLYHASEFATVSQRPQLIVEEWAQNTGHLNRPFANGRSVHCGRSGLPMGANELVEDGWTPGLYVKAGWWDDVDRSQEAELPDTEGHVFDKVTT